jgi:hypothetical protein
VPVQQSKEDIMSKYLGVAVSVRGQVFAHPCDGSTSAAAAHKAAIERGDYPYQHLYEGDNVNYIVCELQMQQDAEAEAMMEKMRRVARLLDELSWSEYGHHAILGEGGNIITPSVFTARYFLAMSFMGRRYEDVVVFLEDGEDPRILSSASTTTAEEIVIGFCAFCQDRLKE